MILLGLNFSHLLKVGYQIKITSASLCWFQLDDAASFYTTSDYNLDIYKVSRPGQAQASCWSFYNQGFVLVYFSCTSPSPAGQQDFVCVTFMRLGQVSVVVYTLVKGDQNKI